MTLLRTAVSVACMTLFAGAALAQDSSPAQLVSAQKARLGLIERVYNTTGQVQPGRLATAASQFGGRIVGLMAAPGMLVKRDQPLAKLRPKNAEMRSSIIANEDRGHIVVANISGIIVKQLQEFGSVVAAGSPIFSIASDTGARIQLDLPIAYAQEISGRSQVRYLTPQGRKVEVKISRSVPLDLSGRGVFPAWIPADKSLGVFGAVLNLEVVIAAHQDALLVPRAALVQTGGAYAVFVINGGIARRRSVSLGIETPDLVEILSGISLGDLVVTRGNYNLVSGTKVTVAAGG